MTDAASETQRVSLSLIDGNIVATVQVELHGDVLKRFGQDVLAMIEETRANALLVDLSNVHVLDVYDFASLRDVARMASLMGTGTVLVGFRPGVAANLAELDADTSGLVTARTVEHALSMLSETDHRGMP